MKENKGKMMISKFSIIFRILDLDSYLPSDYGQEGNHGAPRFFIAEHYLILPSGLMLLASFLLFGFMTLEILNLISVVNSSLSLWPLALSAGCIGFAGFHLIYSLAHRPANQDQISWMNSVSSELHMQKPTQEASKQDLKCYVDAAYKKQASAKKYI